MLDILLVLCLAAHLLCMNVASAGPLVSVWAEWRATRFGDVSAGNLSRTLAQVALAALLLGVALGLAAAGALWLLPQRRFAAALELMPRRKLWWGVVELAFSAVLLSIYWAAWNAMVRRRVGHRALAVLAATNLLYHFPVLFAIMAVVATRPAEFSAPLTVSEFVALMPDPEVLSQTFHFLLAAPAVTGAAVIAIGLRLQREGNPKNDAARVVRWGARLALAASVLQLPVGMCVLLAMPTLAQQTLLGGDLLGASLFLAAIVAVLGLLHYLLALAFDGTRRREALTAILLTALVVTLMTAALHRARSTLYNGPTTQTHHAIGE